MDDGQKTGLQKEAQDITTRCIGRLKSIYKKPVTSQAHAEERTSQATSAVDAMLEELINLCLSTAREIPVEQHAGELRDRVANTALKATKEQAKLVAQANEGIDLPDPPNGSSAANEARRAIRQWQPVYNVNKSINLLATMMTTGAARIEHPVNVVLRDRRELEGTPYPDNPLAPVMNSLRNSANVLLDAALFKSSQVSEEGRREIRDLKYKALKG